MRSNRAIDDCTSVLTWSIEPIGKNRRDWSVVKATIVPAVMVVIACGSTFLGLISEYLVLIPMMVLLAERLGYNALFGVAIVTIAVPLAFAAGV